MKPPMKNIFSLGHVILLPGGELQAVCESTTPSRAGETCPGEDKHGGFGREPRERGGRLSQLTKRSGDFLPARGRGGTCWCFTLFCVLAEEPHI